MTNIDERISELLKEKNKLEGQIKEAHFKGYPEIKEISGKKYIYLRYKKYNRLSSTYAGVYNEQLYNDLKELSKSIRELNGNLRSVKTKLAKLGVFVDELDPKILLNLDFIRGNINSIIYEQAVVEGVSATFLDTEEILENGSSKNVSFDDTLTILNLKNAWQYVLDEDTVRLGLSFNVLSTIAGFVNDRQVSYPDQIRVTSARIGGSNYKPPIVTKDEIISNINKIINAKKKDVFKAIDLLCYLAKTQVFNNGNKRTALIFANCFLISKGLGFISVPDKLDKEYKLLLVDFYEDRNSKVKEFLLEKCYNKI